MQNQEIRYGNQHAAISEVDSENVEHAIYENTDRTGELMDLNSAFDNAGLDDKKIKLLQSKELRE